VAGRRNAAGGIIGLAEGTGHGAGERALRPADNGGRLSATGGNGLSYIAGEKADRGFIDRDQACRDARAAASLGFRHVNFGAGLERDAVCKRHSRCQAAFQVHPKSSNAAFYDAECLSLK
jgi:hypothetical protein